MVQSSRLSETASENIFIIRGFAIFLVCVGHVIGARDSGIRQLYTENIAGIDNIYNFIYTFHMPIFFLASGFSFTVFSNSKHSFSSFSKSRTSRIIMPLLCWAPFYYLFRSAIGKADFQLIDLLQSVVVADFIFWFFPAIFFASILGYFCLYSVRSWTLYTGVSVGLFLLSFPVSGMVSRWIYFNIFYCVGCFMGSYLSKRKFEASEIALARLAWVVPVTGVIMVANYFLWRAGYFPYSVVTLLNGVLAFIALYILLNLLKKWHFPLFLKSSVKLTKETFLHLGKLSMSIYLFHVLFSSTLRTILVKMKVLDPSLQLMIGLLAAIAGPILVYRLLCKNNLFLYSIGETKKFAS